MASEVKKSIKVRFAPSPTGPFSIGNVRTAFFNWLFAKNKGGEFLLRIEDTDKVRSEGKYEKQIIEGLTWLGINWDNKKLIRQSERIEIYKQRLEFLLEKGSAYYCFCSSEELEIERQAQLSQGLQPKYSGRCRSLNYEEAGKRAKKDPSVIRFKIPTVDGHFNDIIRGKVAYNGNLLGDIIIAKSLEEPLYNFAVVVDDDEMEITHVIRGEDHISNTPKQIFIAEALGLPKLHYAHLPLILGPDRKKLSKRFLDKSLLDYKNDGYMKEAMLNFLVLLGWHPQEDREVISVEDMIKEFSLERVQKSGAIFNPEKLNWLNSNYMKGIGKETILESLKPVVPEDWLKRKDFLLKVFEIEKPRIKNLSEFKNIAGFFFELPEYPSHMLIWKKSGKEIMRSNLESILKILQSNPDASEAEKSIMELAERQGRGEVFWPLRVALSGNEASPGPLEILQIIGIEESINRVKIAIDKI